MTPTSVFTRQLRVQASGPKSNHIDSNDWKLRAATPCKESRLGLQPLHVVAAMLWQSLLGPSVRRRLDRVLRALTKEIL